MWPKPICLGKVYVPVYVFGQDEFSFWKIIKTASIFHGYLPIWRTKENVSSHVINVY